MKKSQLSRIAKCSVVLCGLLLASGSTSNYADAQGAHPPYLHAIEHLRQARQVLDVHFSQPNLEKAKEQATPKIEAAISALKQAAKLDDKSIQNLPPPIQTNDEHARFHTASEFLAKAKHDVDGPEADPRALPLRDRAHQDIEAADVIVRSVF